MDGLGTAIGAIHGSVTVDDEFSATFAKLQQGMTASTTGMLSFGKAASQMARAFLPVSAALGGASGFALKMASDFQSSFRGVEKTVNATDEQFALLSKGLRQMAKEIPVNVNELNKIAEAAGQLGIETDHILGFTRVMADLGVTTNLTGEEAATMLARFANITNLPQDQFDRLGATIVGLGNNLATTEREIVEMAMRLAGAGAQIKLSQAEMLGLAGALSSVGIEAEAGGTAFSRVMIRMQDAVATGGEQLALFSRLAGSDFAAAFREDAAGAIDLFIAGLARAHLAGENLTPILETLELGEIRVSDALRRTGNAYQLVAGATDLARTSFRDNLALTEEAQKRYDTFASRLVIAWNKIRDIGITIGTPFLETLTDLLDAGEPLIRWAEDLAAGFAKWPEPLRLATAGIVALGAALAPVAFFLGRIVEMVAALESLGALRLLARFAPAVGAAAAGAVGLAGLGVGAFLASRDMQARLEAWRRQGQRTPIGNAPRLDDQGRAIGAPVTLGGGLGLTLETVRKGFDAVTTSATRSAGAVQQVTAAQRELQLEIFGHNQIARVHNFLAALGDVQDVAQLMPDVQAAWSEEVERSIAIHQRLGQTVPAKLRAVNDALAPIVANQRLLAATSTSAFGAMLQLRGLGTPVSLVPQLPLSPLDLGPTLAAATQVTLTRPSFGELLGRDLVHGLKSFSRQIGDTVLQAITGGGNIVRAIGSLFGREMGMALAQNLSGVLSRTLGSTLGGVITSLLPGIGGIVGGLVGWLFGPSWQEQLEAFAQRVVGSMAGLQEKVRQLGDEGQRMWDQLQDPGKIFGRGRLMRDLEESLARLEKVQTAAARAFDSMSGALDRFGGTAPRALQPLIAELLTSERLTDDMRRNLEALTTGPSWETLAAAAERYGIEQDRLGQGFQQLRSNDLFDELFSDFTLFSDAGADMHHVFEKMAGQVNDLLERSLRFGTALPEFMRPMLEAMAEGGFLAEDLADLSQFQFDASIESSLERIAITLEEIRDFFTAPLTANPPWMEQLADRARTFWDDVTGASSAELPRHKGGPAPAPTRPRSAAELVSDRGAAVVSVAGGREADRPLVLENHIYLDGLEVAQNQMRHMARELVAAGV